MQVNEYKSFGTWHKSLIVSENNFASGRRRAFMKTRSVMFIEIKSVFTGDKSVLIGDKKGLLLTALKVHASFKLHQTKEVWTKVTNLIEIAIMARVYKSIQFTG